MADLGIKITAVDDTRPGFNSVSQKLTGLKSEAASVGDTIGNVMGKFAAIGAVVAAVINTVGQLKVAIDTADEFAKMAQKTGVAVEALRQLNYAASLSDVSTEALGNGLKKLSVNMSLAASGSKAQEDAFKAIGVSVNGLNGNLKGADTVMSELADRFANFKDSPEKAALAIAIFGKAGADMIPLLNSGADGLKAMADEADALGATFGGDFAKNSEKFNDNLTRIGTAATGTAYDIAKELLPSLNTISDAFVKSQATGSGFASFIGKALNVALETVSVLAANVAYAFVGVGRELGAIAAQAVALASLDIKGFNAISAAVKEDGVRARKELDDFENRLLNLSKADLKVGAAYNKRQGFGEAYKETPPVISTATQDAARAAAAAAALKAQSAAAAAYKDAINAQIEEVKKAQAIFEQLAKQSVDKISSEYKRGMLTELDYINQVADAEKKALVSGVGSAEKELAIAATKTKNKKELATLEGALAQAREKLTTRELAQGYAVLELQEKINAERRAFYSASTNSAIAEVDALEEKNKATRFEIEAIGLTGEALAKLTQSRMDDTIAAQEQKIAAMKVFDDAGQSVEAISLQEQKLAKLREQKALAGIKITKTAATEEWTKFYDSVYNGLSDSLYRGFEAGKGFFQSFWDGIKNLFKTTVLKLAVQGVMGGVAGSLGLSSAANAASTGSSLLSTGVTLAGSSIAAIGSSVATGFAAGWAGTSTAAASAAYSAAGMSGVATGLGVGNSVGSVLASIGPAGWAAMAVLAVAAIASGRGETRSGAAYGTDANGKAVKLEGPSGGELSGDSVRGMFDATTAGINDMLKKLGSSDSVSAFVAGLESSKAGKGFVYAGGTLSTGAKFGEAGGRNGGEFAFGGQTAEEAVKGYQLQLKQATLQALAAATDIPKQVMAIVTSVDVTNVAESVLDDLMAQVTAIVGNVNAMNAALKLLPIDYLKDLSFATAAGLAEAAGGFDQFGASLGTFYDKFYSESEKTANATANLSNAFAAMNIVMPEIGENTRDWYRSEVERLGAMDLGIEANAKAYTSALSLSGAVDSLAPSFADITKRASDMAAAFAKTAADVSQSIATLNGVSSSDYAAQQSQAGAASSLAAVMKAMPFITSIAQLKTIDTSAGGDLSKYSAPNQALIVAALAAAATVYTNNQSATQAYTDTSYSSSASVVEVDPNIARIANEYEALQARIYAATDTTAEAAERLRNAIDPLNRAFYDTVVTAEKAKAVATEKAGLDAQLLALTETSVEALTRQRDALDESNRAIFDHIQAIKATQAAYAESKTATDAAMAAVKRAVDAEKNTLNTQIQAAKSLSNEVGSIFETLKSAVQELYGSVENVAQQSAAQARSFIANALTGAQATGSLPDVAELQNAIKAATSGISAGQYASSADMDYERLVLANQLGQLKNVAGDQLTEAERQIKLLETQITKLDDQLAVAQAQYDALNGINTSVMTVKDAIDALTAAMGKQAGAGAAQLYATNAAAVANPDQTGLDYWSNRIKTDGYDATKPAFDASVAYVNNSNSVKDWYSTTAGATANPDQQGVDYWTQQIQDLGAAQAKDLFEQVVASLNIPKMATGTNYVPQDMLAFVHKGEEIKPAAWNPVAGGMGGNNDADIVAELRALRAEVAQLRTATDKGNESAAATADVLVSVKNGSGLNMVPAPTF